LRSASTFIYSQALVRLATLVAIAVAGGVGLGSCRPPTAGAQVPGTSIPLQPGPRVLTLEDALDLALHSNPALGVAAWDVKVSESLRLDAGRRPNPLLAFESENWGGDLGSASPELTLTVEQPIELGGDRGARVTLADAEIAEARADLLVARRDVAEAVTDAFLAAWIAQERLGQLRAARKISSEAVASAGERFKAGAAPAMERIRAEGNLAITEARIDVAEPALRSARRALAGYWAASEAAFDSLLLPSPNLSPPPDPDSVLVTLGQHPELLRAAAEVRAADAGIETVRADRVPNMGALIGVRHLPDPGGTGFVGGISVPLPVWNSQSGSLAAAEARRQRAQYLANSTERRLESEVRSRVEGLAAAVAAYRRLESRAAPAAAEALAFVQSNYRGGRLSYIELLEAQRALLETRLAVVEAAAEVWRARAGLERLTGAVPGMAGEGENQ